MQPATNWGDHPCLNMAKKRQLEVFSHAGSDSLRRRRPEKETADALARPFRLRSLARSASRRAGINAKMNAPTRMQPGDGGKARQGGRPDEVPHARRIHRPPSRPIVEFAISLTS